LQNSPSRVTAITLQVSTEYPFEVMSALSSMTNHKHSSGSTFKTSWAASVNALSVAVVSDTLPMRSSTLVPNVAIMSPTCS